MSGVVYDYDDVGGGIRCGNLCLRKRRLLTTTHKRVERLGYPIMTWLPCVFWSAYWLFDPLFYFVQYKYNAPLQFPLVVCVYIYLHKAKVHVFFCCSYIYYFFWLLLYCIVGHVIVNQKDSSLYIIEGAIIFIHMVKKIKGRGVAK